MIRTLLPILFAPTIVPVMGMIVIILAGLFAACANLCMRRSIDAGGSARAYLVIQISFSCVVGILLNPVRTGNFAMTGSGLALGLLGGLFLGGMLWSMGCALEKGPPGLTFAVVNSATVMPALLMLWILEQPYHAWHAFGSVLVVAGLFWAGWEAKTPHSKVRWVLFASAAFVLHVLLLSLLQWRAAVFTQQTQWFMPIVLLVATLFQLPGFIKERRPIRSLEAFWGLTGGVVSGGATFLLILGPMQATGWQQAMLFPAFAVTVIFASSVWGRTLYHERVNWVAATLCMLGVLLGTQG